MKIVINKRIGGFGLSHRAVLLYAELKGLSITWKISGTSRRVYGEDGRELDPNDKKIMVDYWVDSKRFWPRKIDRSDTVLVEVVEQLGKEADGCFAELKIVEIPDGIEWEIGESEEGYEWVYEKHRTWS